MLEFYFLDLLGTFAFAVYGAYFSARKGFDIFGIFICAVLSALAGGTMREIFLGELPAYFKDYNYFLIIIIGVAFVVVFYKQFKNEKFNFYMLLVDAVGLVTFAYIGASRALESDLGLLGILMFAVLTAVGGGIVRDIVMGEVPQIFYQDFYATPAFLFGLGFYLAGDKINIGLVLYGLLLLVFIIRVVAIKKDFKLWKPIKL